MTNDPPSSPFHPGERAIHARLGIERKIEPFGRKMLRDHMLEQHQSFFAGLPLLFVGSLDESGQPWASVLTGDAGFSHALHSRALRVDAQALPGDPLGAGIRTGAALGILGIELATRRQNRLNGTIEAADATGFTVAVDQSFGNCPKYIQARIPHRIPLSKPGAQKPAPEPLVQRYPALRAGDRELVSKADTFFIATRSSELRAESSHGVDVSHRGGPPRFVSVEDDGTLIFPDYAGNFLFNTLGNLETDSRCGLLFIDFEHGSLLQLAGDAHVLWDDDRMRDVPGAKRLVSFSPREVLAISQRLPFEWEFIDYSPSLDGLAKHDR